MQDPGPVIGSMNPMPVNDELVTDVLEELWAVVEHLYVWVDIYQVYVFGWLKEFINFLISTTPNIVFISSFNSNSFWFLAQAYVVFNLISLTALFTGFGIRWI
jgi:hypothetical protein